MNRTFIINQLGEDRERYFNSVAPPIIQTSNFAYPTVDEFVSAITHEKDEHVYTRGNNPTVNMLCKKLAALEGAEDCLMVGSGAAVRIREDSKWNVPEPELTLAINSRGRIFGYTIGKSIVYGYLPVGIAESGSRVEVQLFDVRIGATVTDEPLFDPRGERLRV